MQDHEYFINWTTSLFKEGFHMVYWMAAEATAVRKIAATTFRTMTLQSNSFIL